MPPRGLTPSGIILVDKPAGPTSFAIVAAVRRRTGARTGHAGTLDPFATGLLLLLSGSATRLQPRFVGLDKRYLTEIDLSARTSTGDPEGEVVEEHEPPSSPELERGLDELRGEIELPIPAASAVKIGGERAYKLHRRGVVVDMPVRRMRIDELRLEWLRARHRPARPPGVLGHVRAGDRGGSRRPLPVAAADGDRAVQRRRSRRGSSHHARRRRGEVAVKVVREPTELEPRPRAVAIGSFDGVHRGHRAVFETAIETGLEPTVLTFDPHPRIALGNKVELLTTLERRLELIDEAGIATCLVAAFTPELQRLTPQEFAERYLSAIGAEIVVAGEDFRFGVRRSGDLELLRELGFETLSPVEVEGVSSTAIRTALADGDVVGAAAMLGRPFELDGVVVAGDQRGGTLGYPTANLRLGDRPRVPGVRDLRRRRAWTSRGRVHRDEPALRRHGAPNRAVSPGLRRRPLRQAPRGRAVGAAPRRGRVRQRRGARGADRRGRRGDEGGSQTGGG